MDPEALQMLADSLRTTMSTASGGKLDAALTELGWLDMLDEIPDFAIPLVFRLLGETGAHAPALNDVVLRAGGATPGETVPLPVAGGSWAVWERGDGPSSALDDELPIHRVPQGSPLAPAALAAGRLALGWWLVGAGRAMRPSAPITRRPATASRDTHGRDSRSSRSRQRGSPQP